MDFSSPGSAGPHHAEMATAGNIFDFHQVYLIDLSWQQFQ